MMPPPPLLQPAAITKDYGRATKGVQSQKELPKDLASGA